MNNECKCKGFYQPVSCPIHGNRPKAEPPDAVLEVFDSVKQYEATKSAIRSIQKCPCKVQCGHEVGRHKLITESGRGVTVCLDCEPKAEPPDHIADTDKMVKASPSLEDAARAFNPNGCGTYCGGHSRCNQCMASFARQQEPRIRRDAMH